MNIRLISLTLTMLFASTATFAVISPGLKAGYRIVAYLPVSNTNATASKANINVITKQPAIAGSPYSNWITVADGRGPIYHVDPSGSNKTHLIVNLKTASPALHIGSAVSGKAELGVRGFAYHPDFANPNVPGYLKFYTMSCHLPSSRSLRGAVALSHNPPPSKSSAPYRPLPCDNVLTEWKMLSPTNLVADPKSRREVLRYPQMYNNHGADALVFDPVTKWLYIAAGDGGSQGDPYKVALDPNYFYGKILRINPLKPGATLPSGMLKSRDGAWSFPASNPGAGIKSGTDAFYVKGMRHPETMFKNGSDLIIADIGGSRYEEIDILKLSGNEGASFGWSSVEGRLTSSAGTIPPVAGYTHREAGSPSAIIVGGIPLNTMGSGFNNQLILGDIISGKIFYGDLGAMKSALSWNVAMKPLHEVVLYDSAGKQKDLRAAFGRYNDGVLRVDLRLSAIDGTIYGVSKQKGILFKLTAF